MRFSLRWLLIAVAFVAVSVAALLNANDYWRLGLRTVLVQGLSVAIVGGIVSTGRSRAFWIGVAIAGWIYLLSGELGYLKDNDLRWVHSTIKTETVVPHMVTITGIVLSNKLITNPPFDEFIAVLRCIMTVGVALFGG